MNNDTKRLFDGMDDQDERADAAADGPGDAGGGGSPRLRRPDRTQMSWEPWCLDERLPGDHAARTVWSVVERLDLSAFYAAIEARGEAPGRPATDPRLLVSLWLYAATEGVGNGRRLARLCEVHDAYRWLCGGVSLNYHTLNDFRVAHESALDELLTQVLASLMHEGLVQVQRISQDGTKVRASAGARSFRRRGRLEVLLAEARSHVRALKEQAEEEPGESARRRSARERAARERVERIESALATMVELEAVKAAQRADKPTSRQAPRASTTDPEARRMRLGDGGFGPAYNVQLATDPESRAIVGVSVTTHGTDHGEDAPLREQVERRTGGKVGEHLVDGGYVKRASIEAAGADGVAVYAPLPATGKNGSVCIENPGDSPAVADWRERMRTPEGQAAYRERASTSETVNADLKTFRGLGSLVVRGLKKVRCVVLWSVLAYNLMHFGAALLGVGGRS
jgi:transposase